MRKKIVAGNWKMNKTLKEGIALADEISGLLTNVEQGDVGVILGIPYIHLAEVYKVIDSSIIALAAQNCSSEPKGAFTGEISAEMIKSTGATYVILGHSERRAYFGENDQLVNKKIIVALENELIPIFCCGEKLDERESGNHLDVVRKQIDTGLFNLKEDDFSRIIIAYEPVWAIGTGVNASPEQVQEIHIYIRNLISRKYGKIIAENTPILYGGSCKPSNARELFANPDVDGGLIGGASLKAEDFLAIIRSFG